MRAKSFKLFVAGFCALLLSSPAYADATIGQPAPAFTTTTLDGKAFDLSTLKGKVVILHFWASWCAPCREEMPNLEAVYRHYHSQGLEVLAISADRPRTRGDVDQVMHYFSFPAAMLDKTSKNELGTVNTVPLTYVIAKDGTVDAIMTPDTQPLTEQGLGDEVKKLLDPKTASPAAAKPDDKPAAAPTPALETKP